MGFDIPTRETGALSFADIANGLGGEGNVISGQNPTGAANAGQYAATGGGQDYGQSQYGSGAGQPNGQPGGGATFGASNPTSGQPVGNYGGQAIRNDNSSAASNGNGDTNFAAAAGNYGNAGGSVYGQSANSQFNQNVTDRHPAATGVSLKKGQKVSLNDYLNGASLTNLNIAIGWDLKQGCPADLDVSAFVLGADGKVLSDKDFVFYGQKANANGSVIHSGDNQTGAGDGDDETILVNILALDPRVQKLVFVITNTVNDLPQDFSAVASAYARAVTPNDNRELFRFQLSEYASGVTALMIGELYNYNGSWKFNPLGEGKANMALAELCAMYGVNLV